MNELNRDIDNYKISNNIFQHIDKTRHIFALNNVKILCSEKNFLLENLSSIFQAFQAHSKMNTNSINRDMEIPPGYYAILKDNL